MRGEIKKSARSVIAFEENLGRGGINFYANFLILFSDFTKKIGVVPKIPRGVLTFYGLSKSKCSPHPLSVRNSEQSLRHVWGGMKDWCE